MEVDPIRCQKDIEWLPRIHNDGCKSVPTVALDSPICRHGK